MLALLIRLVATSALREGAGPRARHNFKQGTKVNRWDPEVQHRGLGVSKSWADRGQRTPLDSRRQMSLTLAEQRWLVQLSATCHRKEGAEPNTVARTGTCPGGGSHFQRQFNSLQAAVT